MSQRDHTTHSSHGSSSEYSKRRKYAGLLKRPFGKEIRDKMVGFFDYAFTNGPLHRTLMSIMQCVSLVQIFLPCLMQFDERVWPHDSVLGRVMSVFSCLSVIYPTTMGPILFFVLFFMVQVYLICAQLSVTACAYSFWTKSKVHHGAVFFITSGIAGTAPWMMNCQAAVVARCISMIADGTYRSIALVAAVFALFFIQSDVTLYMKFTSCRLSFRHGLYDIYDAGLRVKHVLSMLVIMFFSTISGLVQIEYLMFINVLPLGLLLSLTRHSYAWGSTFYLSYMQAVCVVGMIAVVVMPILVALDVGGYDCLTVALLILLFVLKEVFERIHRKTVDTAKQDLEIYEGVETVEEVAEIPYIKLRHMLRVGFETGHVSCHSWKLFELASAVYPTDKGLLTTYVMYASIYPDETRMLIHAAGKLRALKHGDDAVKNVVYQVRSVLQHRERGRLKSLERVLSKIKAKADRCRHQIRYIWECVITGNISELEGLAAQLKRNQEDIERDYQHLGCIYPNNPHVVRAHAAFVVDVLHDEEEASKLQRMYRLLLSGVRSKIEANYYCAVQRFPDLPSEKQHNALLKPDSNRNLESGITSFSAYSTLERLAEFKRDKTSTGRRYVESMIENIQLPATRYGPILIFIFMCLVMPVCAIVGLVFMAEHIRHIGGIVETIEIFARLEISTIQVIYHTFQYVFSEKGYIPTMKDRYESVYDKSIPKFANAAPHYYLEDDRTALLKYVKEAGNYMNSFNSRLRELAKTGYFNNTRDTLLANSIFFYNYITGTTKQTWKIPVEHMISLAATTGAQIANAKTDILFEYPGFWNVLRNAGNYVQDADLMLQEMVATAEVYFNESTVKLRKVFFWCFVVLFALNTVVLTILWMQLHQQKMIVFSSFRALPKSALSKMIRQRDRNNTEDSNGNDVFTVGTTPEENALRLLSAADSDKSGWTGNQLKFILVAIFEITSTILLISWFYLIPMQAAEDLYMYAPLYRDLAAVYSKCMGSYVVLERMAMSGIPFFVTNYPELSGAFSPNTVTNYAEPGYLAETLLLDAQDDVRAFRFGSEEKGYSGIAATGDDVIDFLSRNDPDSSRLPENDLEIMLMTSYDTSISYISRLMLTIVVSTVYTDPQNCDRFDLNAPEFDLISVWLLNVLHKEYTDPIVEILHERTMDKITSMQNILILPIAFACVIMVVCGCLCIPLFLEYGKIASWVPRLLLACHPAVVLQSKAIVKILSNDYTVEAEDSRGATYFYEVLSATIPNGIVFMSNDLTIHGVNDAVVKILGKKPDELIGTNMKTLFDPPPGQDTGVRSFLQAVDDALNKIRSPKINDQFVVIRDGSIATLCVSLNAITSSGEVQVKPTHGASLVLLTLSIRETTATVNAREALEREHQKNEELMTTVLPIQIVKGLQKGDHEISYVSQSVTIGYINVVQFTSWCEKQDPPYIMNIINRLFNTYDEIRAKYPIITKIKTVGDTYICAGGIFEGTNRSHTGHAHDVVAFCLDVIMAVRNLNRELEETLSIRCGCSTGGPVVAGVSGTIKPCFDVIGLVMDVAQVMERTGPPNQVHVTESVYSLIFSQDFVVKEDADVNEDGKAYHTYLVSGLDKVAQ